MCVCERERETNIISRKKYYFNYGSNIDNMKGNRNIDRNPKLKKKHIN